MTCHTIVKIFVLSNEKLGLYPNGVCYKLLLLVQCVWIFKMEHILTRLGYFKRVILARDMEGGLALKLYRKWWELGSFCRSGTSKFKGFEINLGERKERAPLRRYLRERLNNYIWKWGRGWCCLVFSAWITEWIMVLMAVQENFSS